LSPDLEFWTKLIANGDNIETVGLLDDFTDVKEIVWASTETLTLSHGCV